MVDVELAKAAVELVSIENEPGVVRLRGVEGGQLDVASRLRSTAARLPMTGVHEEPMQPGLEALGVAQPADMPPCGDERLLGRILGSRLVVEDQPGDHEEAAGRLARQLAERVVVAAHRPLHENPLHRASRGARPIWSCYSL